MTDVRKTLTEAGYIAIGLGVMGFQQAQVRRRELQARLESSVSCAGDRATDARHRLEGFAGDARHRVAGFAGDARNRVEPIVDRVDGTISERLTDLPEPVQKTVAPVYERVRDLVRSAA